MKLFIGKSNVIGVYAGSNEQYVLSCMKDQFSLDGFTTTYEVKEIFNEKELPEGWDTRCIPYGNKSELKIKDYLEQNNLKEKITDLFNKLNDLGQVEIVNDHIVLEAIKYIQLKQTTGFIGYESDNMFQFAIRFLKLTVENLEREKYEKEMQKKADHVAWLNSR